MYTKECCYFMLCLVLPLWGSCQPAAPPAPKSEPAAPIFVLEHGINYRLQSYVQILADTSTGYAIEDILQPRLQERFVAYPDLAFDIQSNQPYWGKLQLENRLPDAEAHLEWALNFSSTFTHITVFQLAKDGTWTSSLSGAFVPAHQKDFVPTRSGNWFKLILPPGELVTLYFRGESERAAMPPTFHAYVLPITVFYDTLVRDKAGSALFTGLLLLMLLYSCIKFFIVRDRSYLYYAGYLLTAAVYAAYISNDLKDWLGGLIFAEHPAYHSLFKITNFLGLMCWLAFIRSFLDLEHLLPKWDRYFRYLIWLGLPLMGVFIFLAFRYNFSYVIDDRPIMFYIALVTLSGFWFIYPLYRAKDPKGYFIAAGIAAISLGCLLTLLSRAFSPTYSVYYLKAGVIVEILIFSLGLAYRQKKQEEAKQQADFALAESRLLQEKQQLEADRLQELNAFKTRFYTNITHEFRTPLTVIMGMAEQIKDHPQEKSLIQRNSESLLRLINQLLDLSKLESGSLTLKPVHRDINLYLQYLTESFYSAAHQKGIRLVFHSEAREIWMDYDEEKIQQIVYNLLSNALKFTAEMGQIILHASEVSLEGQPFLRLKVKDTGRGIPAEDLHRVFERFYQSHPAEDGEGGTGIGLSLVKELTEFMGGRIEVASEPGFGAEFKIYLPITAHAPTAAPDAPQAAARAPFLPSAGAETFDQAHEEALKPELPVLLIIEDNPDIITYIKTILAGQYSVHAARNGLAGIEQAIELVPDLIISDVMMPGKNGYEVCETLKQDQRTSHIPIILLTAKATQQDKVAGLRFGADAYLNKPFDQEELLLRIENLLRIRQQMQQRYARLNERPDAGEELPAATPAEEAFFEKLHQLIHAHLSDAEFGVPQLAAAAHLSQMQLYRKLKALTGQTPSRFIRSYRLLQGLELLKQGQLTVSEVAYEVGFTDPSYFSRAFQEEFKNNPSYYLK
jgi:signal transduction histidine kinase/DNA-binding response OmpR family regulator